MLETLVADCLSSGRPVRFRAPGHSMWPLIRSNDALIVHPIDPAAVAAGDILLYRSGAGLTAHRCIQVLREGDAPGGACFLFKGDAGSQPDAPVAAPNLLGKVIAVERDGRRIDPYSLSVWLRARIHRLVSRLNSRLLHVS
jgi:hypothetical protein